MKKRLAVVAAAGLGLVVTLACSGGSTLDTSFLAPSARSGGTASCPSGAATVESFDDGARVVLIAINNEDAYAGSEFEGQLPIAGTVKDDLHKNGDCWYGGGFVGDNGADFYFYKAAFRPE